PAAAAVAVRGEALRLRRRRRARTHLRVVVQSRPRHRVGGGRDRRLPTRSGDRSRNHDHAYEPERGQQPLLPLPSLRLSPAVPPRGISPPKLPYKEASYTSSRDERAPDIPA